MAGKHVALHAIRIILMLHAWCVVIVGVCMVEVTMVVNTLVGLAPTQAREEQSHCDEM